MKKKKLTKDDFYSVDSLPLTDEQLSEMRPHKELFPDWPDFIREHTTGDVEEWKKELKPRRGPQKEPTKVPVSIRLSPDLVEYFKSSGKGWQTRIDQALREYVETH